MKIPYNTTTSVAYLLFNAMESSTVVDRMMDNTAIITITIKFINKILCKLK